MTHLHPHALLSTADCLEAISRHSTGLASAAAVAPDLTALVPSCPGWSLGDLVWHVREVHWFWATIAGERLAEPPPQVRRPARAADADLLDALAAGATQLLDTLGAADQTDRCWTWAGWQQDVAFVTRHQVQEAAVHHFDAAVTAHVDWAIEPRVAADCVDEFLHFSVASDDDPDDPVKPPLEGTLALRATDTGHEWTLVDGRRPGTVRIEPGAPDDVPAVEGTAGDLLLWLYEREPVSTSLDAAAVPADLVARLRAMCFTD